MSEATCGRTENLERVEAAAPALSSTGETSWLSRLENLGTESMENINRHRKMSIRLREFWIWRVKSPIGREEERIWRALAWGKFSGEEERRRPHQIENKRDGPT